MSGRRVITLIPCHLSSKRVYKKPLQTLSSGACLIENALEQVARLKKYLNPHVSCWDGDVELVSVAESLDIPIIPMTFEQSRASDWETIGEAWTDLQADWIYEINNICHPFVKDATILGGLNYASFCDYPFISAVRQRNLYWNESRQVLLPLDGPVDTKTAPTIISATHMLYAWQPSDCGKGNSTRITNVRPYVIDCDPIELLDVDTHQDLELIKRIICK